MRALAALLFLLPACSVSEASPNPPMDAPPPDVGDAGVDAFDVSLDALPDAPDAPPNAFVRPRESNCANTLDDDDDGLTDCGDPDCASDATKCCMPMGVPAIVNETWCRRPPVQPVERRREAERGRRRSSESRARSTTGAWCTTAAFRWRPGSRSRSR